MLKFGKHCFRALEELQRLETHTYTQARDKQLKVTWDSVYILDLPLLKCEPAGQ